MSVRIVGVALCLLGHLSVLARAQVVRYADEDGLRAEKHIAESGEPRTVGTADLAIGGPDSNENGTPDDHDIAAGVSLDCDENGVPDECDLAAGVLHDVNGNGVPDECEVTLYVDASAPDGGTGQSWPDAMTALQDALTAASEANGYITEIHVAQGTYHPDIGGGNLPGDQEATFQLLKGVALRGGYVGLADSASPDARDPNLYETFLNGYVNGSDDRAFPSTTYENCYHVVTSSYTDATAVLDGVTITAGFASVGTSIVHSRGGGVYNDSGSPTLLNCKIRACVAWQYGGGMYSVGVGSPTLIDCSFSRNHANSGGGGGLANMTGSAARITSCRFDVNSTTVAGGGIYNDGGSLTVSGSSFYGNQSWIGGGVYSRDSAAVISNCSFVANHAAKGGAFSSVSDLPRITNGLFAGNTATDGGAIWVRFGDAVFTNCTIAYNSASESGGGALSLDGTPLTLQNSILWENRVGDDTSESSQVMAQAGLVVRHSCIQGLDVLAGNGNIGLAPQFVDIFGGTCPPATTGADLSLRPGSPCADAGDNQAVPSDMFDLDGDGVTNLEPTPLDLNGHPRFSDDPCAVDSGIPSPAFPTLAIVDMGAYERPVPESDDADLDGISYCDDNCPFTSNPDQGDQNDDGLGDACSINDCNGNNLPDECDVDCNANGNPDSCDLVDGLAADCNENGTPDECEIPGDSDAPDGPYFCSVNCDTDCNENGLPDACDIADGVSLDENENGIPDECRIVVYVDRNAQSGGDGTSWASAFRSLGAFWIAGTNGYEAEFRVAQGQYGYVELNNGMTLRGGFAGWGAADPDLRRPHDFVSHASHVSAGDTVLAATVDGFTISGGIAYYPHCGGGVHIDGGSITIVDCSISDNATEGGQGDIIDPITDAANGAGMCVVGGATVVMDRCVFARNETGLGNIGTCKAGVPVEDATNGGNGGGIYVENSQLFVSNSVFAYNKTGDGGNCWLCGLGTGTRPGYAGFGSDIAAVDSEVVMRNCTRYGNEEGGDGERCDDPFPGLADGGEGGAAVVRSIVTCIDCITWGPDGGAGPDPLLVDPVIGDFRVSGGSPAIDDGDPGFETSPGETDFAGRSRVLCGRVDRGAFEFAGDYDCDHSVGLTDHAGWQDCVTGPDLGPYAPGCESFDFNTDSDVDLRDQADWQNSFGL